MELFVSTCGIDWSSPALGCQDTLMLDTRTETGLVLITDVPQLEIREK